MLQWRRTPVMKRLEDGFIGESDVLKSLFGSSGLGRVPFRTRSLVLRLEVAFFSREEACRGR